MTGGYSLDLRCANRAEALAAVRANLDSLAAAHPCHAPATAPALEAARAFIGALPDAADMDVAVAMGGYISEGWSAADQEVAQQAMSLTISVGLIGREPPLK
jgi:hypothetical protein